MIHLANFNFNDISIEPKTLLTFLSFQYSAESCVSFCVTFQNKFENCKKVKKFQFTESEKNNRKTYNKDLYTQIRLDFNTFVISGPSTDTVSIGKILNGQLAKAAGLEVSNSGRCLTDLFTSKFKFLKTKDYF